MLSPVPAAQTAAPTASYPSGAPPERLWAAFASQTPDIQIGIFGPESVSWKVNRESALFLGAGRAALLQLAHPWVTAALDQHSNLRNDPVSRFHNTFRVVFTMIFGTRDQALAASRHLYRLHSRIEGGLPEAVAVYPRGSLYRANEVQALCWVYATLLDSALLAYESVLPPLTMAEREAYYRESKTMAALFGIPPEALPADWAGFEGYMRAMFASDTLGVNSLAREMARGILRGSGSWVPIPQWYRALTAAWMPERLRAESALEFTELDRAAATRALRWLRRGYKSLPSVVRFVGPYHEALARLEGRRAGPLVHASNRFWMGQPQTMFVELSP
jgi:uncharacterized protein (DUF2236 family)